MRIDIATKAMPSAFVVVDDDDAHLLDGIKWTPTGAGYAHREVSHGKKKYLHRIIAGACPGEIVDHINRDRSDNRRTNLRIVDSSLNARNRSGVGESFYRGVHRKRGKWQAQICANGEAWALGCFATEIEAARAYDDALAFFGLTDAGLNLPDREPVATEPRRREIAPHGLPGIRRLDSGRFNVRAIIGGKRIGLGTFATVEEAKAAWAQANG